MPDINPSLPIIGQPNSTEEPKVVTALSQLIAAVNDVDSAQILDLAVSTADIANNAVTAAKIEAQQAWQTVALSGFTGNLSYYKDSLGQVHLRGDVFTSPGGGITSGTTLATLPAGYRPASTQQFNLPAVQGATAISPGIVRISTAGAITNSASLSASVDYSFGHIHFRGEN